MATINIRRDINDSFYRYKMPKIISKVEGKGNGIKTVIPNMSDIAKSLSRPPTYPTKFFGCELGAQVKCDGKNDRYIVNGAHDAPKLQAMLDVFIDKFVLCPECKNPETDLIIQKDQNIIRDCKACGQRLPVDMGHKLVTFIIKNPPPVQQKARKSNGGSNNHSPPAEHDGGSEDFLTRRIQAEAASLPKAERQIGDEDWAEDTSPEAIAARVQALENGITRSLLVVDDEEENSENVYDQLGEFLSRTRSLSNAEILVKTEELGVAQKHRTLQVLAQVLFNEDILSQLQQRAGLLKKLMRSEKHQRSLLGGIERLVGIQYPPLLKKVPLILKELYEHDILEEELILKWGKKPSKRYVEKDLNAKIRERAQPFLKWLEEAEEESSEEVSD